MNIKKYWVSIYLLLITLSAFTQTRSELILLDQDSNLPIPGVTYQYGDQSGISDNDGKIIFNLNANVPMKCSHVTYGTWELDFQALSKATEKGVFYRKDQQINLYPVTVIAVKGQQSKDSKINLDYQDHMAHDGAAVLNQSAGFNSIRKSGSYGYDPVFRGFKYDQINVVLNGAQSATAACPNRMDPPTSQMAPNMMDRIEILKGPYALRYGAGVGATINFIPTALRFTSTNDLYGRVSSAYEGNGNIFRNEAQVGLSNQKLDFSIFGSWSQGDDYTDGDGNTVQSDFSRGSFGTNLGVKISTKQQLRLSAVYNRARDADFVALPMDLRDDDTWMFNARHDVSINRGNLTSWNTTFFGSFVDHKMDNLLKNLDPRMMNAYTDATTFNYGGRTEGVWKYGNGSLFAGADFRNEGAEGTRTREMLMGPMAGMTFFDNVWQDGHISKTGLFGEYQMNNGSYQMVISGRIEYNQANVADPSSEFSAVHAETENVQINPGLSLGVSKPINNRLKVGLWLGRVQRSGSLTERYINFFPVGQDPYEVVGNPDLKPEVNNQFDLTLAWNTENSAINIDGFVSYLQDYITSRIDPTLVKRLPTSAGVRNMINIDNAYKTGFEITWTQKLPANLQHRMGLAYTYAQDLSRDEPLPEVAPLDFRYTLKGSYLDGKLIPSATFRQVLKQDRISVEYGETVSPAFSLLDVEVGYKVFDFAQLNIGVNNLLDQTYYEHLSRSVRGTTDAINAPGRNIYTSLNLTF